MRCLLLVATYAVVLSVGPVRAEQLPARAQVDGGGIPNGQPLDVFLSSMAKSVLDYIPRELHAGILAGTGTADVTAYLDAALNDRRFKVHLIPPGLYPVTGLLVNTPNHRIHAVGAQIRNAANRTSSTIRILAPANNVFIDGGDWVGSGHQNYPKPLPTGVDASAVYFGGVQDVGIEGATAREAIVGISMEGVERYAIRNNRVSRAYVGPNIGTTYANYGFITGNVASDAAAENISVDNTSHDVIVQGNRLTSAGYKVPGENPPSHVPIGCFGGIGAGASSNNNVFDSNIITRTSCNGIGISGKNNRITNNIITDVVFHGILEQYYSGKRAEGTCCMTSDQGGNFFGGNSFNAIGSGIAIRLEHDTRANVIGPNNYNGTRVSDATNGTQGNVFVNESGTLFVTSAASAALTAGAFGKYVQTQGGSDWRITLPPADQLAGGRIEVFCNSAAQTIRTPVGSFGGPYGGGATKTCAPGATLTFRSDGFNWQILQSSRN